MDDKRLERIEKKVDDTNEHLASIDLTLAAQHVSLKHHIKRSDLLEAKLAPIERHVAMVSGAIKFIMLIGTIIAILGGIRMLIK